MPRKKKPRKPLHYTEFYIKDLTELHVAIEVEETEENLSKTYRMALQKCSAYILMMLANMSLKERQEYSGCILTDLLYEYNLAIPNKEFRFLSYAMQFWQRMGLMGKNCTVVPETGIKSGFCNVFRFPLFSWYFADRRLRKMVRSAYKAMRGELNCDCVKFCTPDWEVVIWRSGRIDAHFDINSSFHEVEIFYGYAKGKIQIGDLEGVAFNDAILTTEEIKRKIPGCNRRVGSAH